MRTANRARVRVPRHVGRRGLGALGALLTATLLMPTAIAIAAPLPPDVVVAVHPYPADRAGRPVGFEIDVTNIGATTAEGVVLTDALPPGFTWSVAEPNPACVVGSTSLTCDIGELEPRATVTVHVFSPTDATQCGTIFNTALVAAVNEAPEATTNNTSTAGNRILCADLSMAIAGNGPLDAGDLAVFTVTLSGEGDSTHDNPVLVAELPSEIEWWIPGYDLCTYVPRPVTQETTCVVGSVEPGSDSTVRFEGETVSCDPISISATITAASDPNPSNDSADALIDVGCDGPHVTATAVAREVYSGDPVAFTIEILALPEDTADVLVEDVLPAMPEQGWSITGGDESQWSIVGDVLRFGPQDMALGMSSTVHISSVTNGDECGLISNTVSLTSASGSDSDGSTIRVFCNGPISTLPPTDAMVAAPLPGHASTLTPLGVIGLGLVLGGAAVSVARRLDRRRV